MVLFPCYELKSEMGLVIPTIAVRSPFTTYRHTLCMVWRSSHPDIQNHELVWVNDEADAVIMESCEVRGLAPGYELRIVGKEPEWSVENSLVKYTGDGSDLVDRNSKAFYQWWSLKYAK